jgi:hypothetical protein
MQSTRLLDSAGRRRSPGTTSGFHERRAPRNKGLRYPPDPPAIEENEVKLAVSRCQAPDGGGEEAARREVVGREWRPGGCVRGIGDEAAVELVQRISQAVQVGLVTVWGDIDVEGVVATAIRLNARAADDYELHAMIDQRLQERFALGVDGKGSRDWSLLA